MRRLLQSVGHPYPVEPPMPESVDYDDFVIVAFLLCALTCVLGLAFWLRRFASSARGTSASAASLDSPVAPEDKGLKKKALESIPTVAYNGAAVGEKLSECAICLMVFVEGDAIRVLPQCGHGFHVGCVDAWLGFHSSCPSCRTIVAIGRCRKCGVVSGVEGEAKPSRPALDEIAGGDDRYLP